MVIYVRASEVLRDDGFIGVFFTAPKASDMGCVNEFGSMVNKKSVFTMHA